MLTYFGRQMVKRPFLPHCIDGSASRLLNEVASRVLALKLQKNPPLSQHWSSCQESGDVACTSVTS